MLPGLFRIHSCAMGPKIQAKPTDAELAKLPSAAYSGRSAIIQKSMVFDHAKHELQHGVKQLEIVVGPLIAAGKRTYWCRGQGEYSHIVTQISAKHLGRVVSSGGTKRGRESESPESGALPFHTARILHGISQ